MAILLALAAAKIIEKNKNEIPLAPYLCAANAVVYIMEVILHG